MRFLIKQDAVPFLVAERATTLKIEMSDVRYTHTAIFVSRPTSGQRYVEYFNQYSSLNVKSTCRWNYVRPRANADYYILAPTSFPLPYQQVTYSCVGT